LRMLSVFGAKTALLTTDLCVKVSGDETTLKIQKSILFRAPLEASHKGLFNQFSKE
jgi:hypothetical protein